MSLFAPKNDILQHYTYTIINIYEYIYIYIQSNYKLKIVYFI